jgi:hypothetical protein
MPARNDRSSPSISAILRLRPTKSIQGFLISPALAGPHFEQWVSAMAKPAAPASVKHLFQKSG